MAGAGTLPRGSVSARGKIDSSTATPLIGRIAFQVNQRLTGMHASTTGWSSSPPRCVLTQDRGQPITWPPGRPRRQDELEKFAHPPDFTERPWAPLPPLPAPLPTSGDENLDGGDTDG